MNAVLTSSLGGAFRIDGKRVPSVLIEKNGLLEKVKSLWPEKASVLMICASPSNHEKNDAVLDCFQQSLPMSGLNFSSLDMCDDRNEEPAAQIKSKNVIILTGGTCSHTKHIFQENQIERKPERLPGPRSCLECRFHELCRSRLCRP